MRVRLLSGQAFSHFGELWLAWSHGGGITSRMYALMHWRHAVAHGEARWAVGIGGGSVALGRMVGFVSCKPADVLLVSSFLACTTRSA